MADCQQSWQVVAAGVEIGKNFANNNLAGNVGAGIAVVTFLLNNLRKIWFWGAFFGIRLGERRGSQLADSFFEISLRGCGGVGIALGEFTLNKMREIAALGDFFACLPGECRTFCFEIVDQIRLPEWRRRGFSGAGIALGVFTLNKMRKIAALGDFFACLPGECRTFFFEIVDQIRLPEWRRHSEVRRVVENDDVENIFGNQLPGGRFCGGRGRRDRDCSDDAETDCRPDKHLAAVGLEPT